MTFCTKNQPLLNVNKIGVWEFAVIRSNTMGIFNSIKNEITGKCF